MAKDIIIVESLADLYDEKSEALTANIANRKFCLKHDWVNASLHWSKQVEIKTEGEKSSGSCYHISIESPAREKFNPEWGIGYGGIRFCRNCKQIDCIHLWEWEKEYHVGDEFYHVASIISKCRICKRKILKGSFGTSTPSLEAQEMIARIVEELQLPYGDPVTSRYGSNFYTVLPEKTSRLLKNYPKGQAEEYIRSVFASGVCLK